MNITHYRTTYVDHLGYTVMYNVDSPEMMGTVLTGEIYHYFNGAMLLGVF